MIPTSLKQAALPALVMALGAAVAAPAWAQNAPSRGAAVFEGCPDPMTAPADVSTPCLAIVQFDATVSGTDRAAIARGTGAILRFNLDIISAVSVLVPNQRAYWALASEPNVTAFVPDRRVQAFGPPGACEPWPECKDGGGGDSGGGDEVIPAGVHRVGADQAQVWDAGITGEGITVAVLDTGLDSDHPDLAGNIIGGVTCLGDETTASCDVDGGEDDNGHGTHVGGIIAAIRGNGMDVVGVAPQADLYSVKVLDSSGGGWDSNIIAGLNDVVTQKQADPTVPWVVNMSLGRPGDCSNRSNGGPVSDALDSVVSASITVVVAAGNDRNQEVSDMVPAGCPQVIAVASTTAEDGNNKCKFLAGNITADTASYFTTDGAGVTISAPGETKEDNSCGTISSDGIESLAMGGGTTRKSGTSMAAPHVAGIAALMLQKNYSLGPNGIRANLSADCFGSAPKDHPYISESLDGYLEGVALAPGAIGQCQ